MAGRGAGRTVLAILVVVGVGGLAGCGHGSDDDGTRTTTVPDRSFVPASDPSGLKEPGTEIADGVHVQPDSALVAVAFPSIDVDGGARSSGGWEAVVAVQGDPIDVWNAYADELGIGDDASAEQACIVQAERKGDQRDATETQRFLTEPALDDELRLWCRARIGATEVSMASGVVGCVRPDVSDDPCELRSGSSMFIRQGPDDGGESVTGDALGTDDLRADRAIPDGPIVRPEFEGVGPSNLPGPGERIDDGIDHFLGTSDEGTAAPAILPAGAESLIAPATLIDCGSGLVAVVALPQEPATALAAFAPDHPEGSTEVQTGELGDRTWATRSFDAVGGYELHLTAVSGDEPGSSYVLATECGD